MAGCGSVNYDPNQRRKGNPSFLSVGNFIVCRADPRLTSQYNVRSFQQFPCMYNAFEYPFRGGLADGYSMLIRLYHVHHHPGHGKDVYVGLIKEWDDEGAEEEPEVLEEIEEEFEEDAEDEEVEDEPVKGYFKIQLSTCRSSTVSGVSHSGR